jgi:uncharacterized protein (DUF2062 family)
VAIGLAIGMTPLWGVHWAIVLLVCVPLRLDAPVAFLASNISLPFIAPFLTFAEVGAGHLLRTGGWPAIDVDTLKRTGVGGFLWDLVVGTALLAPAVGALGGIVTSACVRWRRGRAVDPPATQ